MCGNVCSLRGPSMVHKLGPRVWEGHCIEFLSIMLCIY